MVKKIYIVIGTFSSWDSYNERVLKAFNSNEDAIKYSDKANRILKEFAEHIGKVNGMQEYDEEKHGDMSPQEVIEQFVEIEETKEYKVALNIWNCHSNLDEFNKCKIQEVELI